jgi:hypothetical protein
MTNNAGSLADEQLARLREALADCLKQAEDPSSNAYEGRCLWDKAAVFANWTACQNSLESVRDTASQALNDDSNEHIVQTFTHHRHRFASPQTVGGVGQLVERLRADLEAIQWGDRPLPWVVHTGCSYRRIASEPTRENPRSFPDGNVLHALRQSDGHPDLSMGERELEALVRLVNSLPNVLNTIASLTAERDAALARCEEMREALEPFAKALDDWGDEPEQSDRRNLYEHPAAIGIGIGDLRRARAALDSGGGK